MEFFLHSQRLTAVNGNFAWTPVGPVSRCELKKKSIDNKSSVLIECVMESRTVTLYTKLLNLQIVIVMPNDIQFIKCVSINVLVVCLVWLVGL